ncbi:DUF4031 domain-containing protein [Pimelobacter simplex]|uniref:DUF4031 domain-containing protein n=1 Tax=Nocardioides simplex TaxID=2045 RepID=A0A7J5DSL6_NOCSI|nr:DUF4031 domain-containing protein [Pimelobacter simplex]KAB2807894.1 DUF4031 domain-containing protein [Pimelobacter simplex]
MTVYVDDMQLEAVVGPVDGVWSHLLSDLPGAAGHRELLDFADRLGIEARWIQKPGTAREHFDVTEPTRQRALALGAVPIRYGRAVAAITRAKRDALSGR